MGSVDSIFLAEEPVDRPARRGALVLQFFLVPLLIVVAAVGVFVFFGALAGSTDTPHEILDRVMGGGQGADQQAHQLAVILRQEQERLAAGKDPSMPPFWGDPAFRRKLERAFVDSFPDGSADRRAFLAQALGLVGDPAYLPALRAHLDSEVRGQANPLQVRIAVAEAIGRIPGPEPVDVLVPLLSDREEVLRNYAVRGLSARDTPASREALKKALSDESPYVRANAGAALASFGDAAGAPEVGRLLDRDWVQRMIDAKSGTGGTPAGFDRTDLRRTFLRNGLNGALGLRDESLRSRVEELTGDGDEQIRQWARSVLDRWPRA